MQDNLRIIAFTHKTADLKWIGELAIEREQLSTRLSFLRSELQLDELMLLQTCNRFEVIFCSENTLDSSFAFNVMKALFPEFTSQSIEASLDRCALFNGVDAVYHTFEVASSLDSLVVGEREIITQVRTAYELCNELGFTGDTIRLLVKHTIETAKEVYTRTGIASRPVSVVSLAYRNLKELNVADESRILIIGAGQTNTLMSEFLKKHGFKNFVVFNRTLANGKNLAEELKGNAYPLSELSNYKEGFDVILTCTAAAEHIISPSLYSSLLNGETDRKIIIDLSVPNDLDPAVCEEFDVHYIDVTSLQAVANENLLARRKELEACRRILGEQMVRFNDIMRERQVELAMKEIPAQVRMIRENALNTVFNEEVSSLDPEAKEVLDKILAYVEKKYISVPMVMAKEILLDKPVKSKSSRLKKVE